MGLRNKDVFQAFQIWGLFSNALNDKFVFTQIWDNLYFHIFLLKPLCDLLFMPTMQVSVKHIAEEKNLMFFTQKTKCLRNFLLNNTKSKIKSQILLKILTWKWSCYCLDVLYSWFGLLLLLQSCPSRCDPIDSSPPGSLSLGFSRQEHWSGSPFPSPVHESEKWKWSLSVVFDP